MTMNLNPKLNVVLAMQVYARVVEAGTFTRAADSLQMPKPTVTKLVQGLESHLRVKLLNRTTRKVTVTPDGAAYYERATRLLGDLEEIESSVANAQSNPKGRLRIDAGGTLARSSGRHSASSLLAPSTWREIVVRVSVYNRMC